MSDELEGWDLGGDGIASLFLGPNWSPPEGTAILRSIWPRLQRLPEVKAVSVVASSSGLHCAQLFPRDEDRGSCGPKSNGLLKPFGIAIKGSARNAILELIAEADVGVATHDATFADTSMFQGLTPEHSIALKKVLPDLEVTRISLIGERDPMSSARALELHLIEAVVSDDQLEPELNRRLAWLAPPG